MPHHKEKHTHQTTKWKIKMFLKLVASRAGNCTIDIANLLGKVIILMMQYNSKLWQIHSTTTNPHIDYR